MKKPRDSQRSKVYTAERMLHDLWRVEIPEVSKVEAFIAEILDSRWYAGYWPRLPECDPEAPRMSVKRIEWINVKDGRGTSTARGSRKGEHGGVVNLPRWARSNWVILHEMTHVLQTEAPWHGRQFARIYMDMVTRWINPDAGKLLRDAYRLHKVKYMAKRPGTGLTELPPWLRAASPKEKK